MSKKKPLTYRRKVIFLIVASILLLLILVVGKLILFQVQFAGSNTENKTNLLTFSSTRVPLTFNHPIDFPVVVADKKYLDKKTLEALNFSETYLPNSTDDSYGYLIVTKQEIADLDKYLTNYYINQVGSKIKMEMVTINKSSGYRVHMISDAARGSSLESVQTWTYYFYKNGLLYQMALTNPVYHDSNADKINTIFVDTILASLRFE